MPTNYLPKLKTGNDNKLTLPNVVGVWSDGPRLHELANAIEVQPGATNIHSIPAPWARIILFTRALFDEDHVLHDRILGEWRGVLAILGLKEKRRFSELNISSITLDDEAQTTGSFANSLSRVPPNYLETIQEDASWETFHLLRWHGTKTKTNRTARAFGLTSPSTLVATGVSYEGVIDPDDVPWFVDGVLVDPTEDHLGRDERSLLAQWVLQVRNCIARLDGGGSSRQGQILDLLGDYAEDLDAKIKLKPADEVLSKTGLGLDSCDLFRTLNYPHKAISKTISDVRIVTDRADAPVYVLIEPSLSRQLNNRPERDITIYRSTNLATAEREIAASKTNSTGTFMAENGQQPVNWCTADFFFQKELIYEQGRPSSSGDTEDSFPGCLRVKTEGESNRRHAAFPLTEDAARLFTAEYLADHLTLFWLPPSGKKDGEIAKAVLQLEIRQELDESVIDGQQTPSSARSSFITIEHIYKEADKNQISNLPALCLWPNFRFDDESTANPAQKVIGAVKTEAPSVKNRWARYYLLESWRRQTGSDNFVVTPLGGGKEDARMITDGGEFFQVTVMSRFPEVLVCQMPFGDKPRTNDSYPPKALLLLRRPEPVRVHNGQSVAVGIDFGTTGTSIYRALGVNEAATGEQEDVSTINFANRIFQITDYDKNEFQRLTRDLFLPAAERSSGNILSIFQDFAATGDRLAVRDGHVLFVPELAGNTFISGDHGSIRSNLKWGTDRQNVAARDFLSQLCTQTLVEVICEGATSVDIRYSYPTAFSDQDLEWFRAIWFNAIRQLKGITSVGITCNDAGVDNCEAVAATRFFAHGTHAKRLNIARGAITLDIGGGTTDIAVWNRDPESTRPTLLAHLSVLFAGKDIFLAVVREKPELLTIIDDDAHYTLGAIETLKQLPKGSQAYNAELDATVSKYGQRLMERLGDYARQPEIREFLSILQLGLCGISFYTGLLIGQLVEKGTYDMDQTRIPVFVGGNGSKLLQWCSLGQPMNSSSGIARSFANSLICGAQIAAGDKFQGKSVDVIASPRPKEEVAYGLVVRSQPLARNDSFVNPPAGENYSIGPKSAREEKDWTSAPDLETLRTKFVQVDPKLSVFRKFLESIDMKLSDQELYDVADAVDREIFVLAEAAKAAEDDSSEGGKDSVRKQPMFIMALKHLVDKRIIKMVTHV